jgi:hypothetical protein
VAVRAEAARLIAWRGGPARIEKVSDPANPDRKLFKTAASYPAPTRYLR